METTNKRIRKRDSDPNLVANLYGKLPPQAKDLEQVVLGAIMLEREAFNRAADIITTHEAFYVEAHKHVFQSMVRLSEKNTPIDMLTVVEELKRMGKLDDVGGVYAISQLTNHVVSAAHIEAHCDEIMDKFVKREIARVSGELTLEAYNEESTGEELIEQADKKLTEISTGHSSKTYTHISDGAVQSIERILQLRELDQDITGIPSQFADLDKITHGWQNTDLIILAARPSVGKTAFALNLARAAASNAIRQTPVGVFSLEMNTSQLINRLLSCESSIPMEKMNTGRMEEYELTQLHRAMERMSKWPIFIDDTSGITIQQLRAKARAMKRKENVGLIIVDYLQLMTGDKKSGNREQEISKISRDLKTLAKELEVPVIALSQLSRETEKRQGDKKTPQLSDLRDSGAIEQDADIVMFLYRPEYYNVNANEHGESTRGETHVKIAKHRNGTLDTIKLQARLEIQKFENYSNDQYRPSDTFTQVPSNFRPISELMKPNHNDPF